ncbi:MAG: DHH family phosphoesterase [Anaerolineales bacterium]|nr:DHH family phosphoesterase [Anaerolineales bacterium]MDO9348176.1 DHH family phosphoesterase [Anaerolineales bacterium]
MDQGIIVAIKERLLVAQNIFVVSHVRPDGDAVGSLLAFGLALQEAGKKVQMVLADGVPSSFRHLPGSGQIRKSADGTFDLIVTLDCADLKRVGRVLDGYGKPDINIDHHITNELFGALNLIEPDAVATSSILFRHLPEWGYMITQPVAANLVTGIVTDTLGFRTTNTTPESLRQVAALMELGVDMTNLYYRGLVRRSFPAARYWAAGLSSLQRADGIVWGTMTLADRKNADYPGNDDADLINVISSIEDCDISMIFVEQTDGTVKISWRTQTPELDVSRIAKQFGGGGHPGAAGADVTGTLAEVQESVLAATRRALYSR